MLLTVHSIKRLLALLLLSCLSFAQAAEQPTDNTAINDQLAEIMAEARQAMREAQYNAAIRNYRKLADMADHAYRRDAMELLGLAYERNGQLKLAKESYQRYILLYPEGVDSERVRQRLLGLTTAAWDTPDPLEKEKKRSDNNWRSYGSFSQNVRRDAGSFEQQPEVLYNYSLSSQLDYNLRGRTDQWDIRSRVNAGHSLDLDGSNDKQSLSYLYVDMQQRQGDLGFRLGRQRANGGGVLGRFDGLNLSYRLTDKQRLGFVMGMPVERTSDISPNSARQFYGLNLNSGPWAKYWEMSGYLIHQNNQGLLDRQAMGGELRYMHPQRTLYSLVDYDLNYGQLNIATLQGSYTLEDKSSFTLLLDYRSAPLLTTGNALIGQLYDDLDEMRLSYSEQQIQQLALDRTAYSSTFNLGYSKPLNEDMLLNLDLSTSELSATPESGGVLATESTGLEYYIMGRLSWNNLWRAKDRNWLSVRFAELSSSSAITLSVNSRQAWKGWYLTPRLQWDSRSYQNGDSQTTIAPGIRGEYQWEAGHLFEVDAGWENSSTNNWLGSQNNLNSYYNIGYRRQF